MAAPQPTTDLNVPYAAAAHTANSTSSLPPVLNNPPYAEKRRPGRPPKQAAVPVFVEQSQLQNAATGPLGPVNFATGPVGGTAVGGNPNQGGVKRGRGRPKKYVPNGRRGRPPKPHGSAVAAVDDRSVVARVGSVAGKRRGRPPKAGSVPKKSLSGKPRGRPRKTASTSGSQTPVNLQKIAGLDFEGKLRYFQLRIKQTVSIIKPLLNSETAFAALQELETLATMDVKNIPPQS